MTAGMVAASVRSRAAISRRVGPDQIRSLATSQDIATALLRLSNGPYGHDVHVGQGLAEAQHGVAASYLWNVRVLAGWAPPRSADTLRVLAAWAEIANVESLLRGWSGGSPSAPYALGSLATAWPRLRSASSRTELRELLAASPWGDPGADDERSIQLAMRFSWCARVVATVPIAAEWARAAAVVMVTHELGDDAGPSASEVSELAARVLGPTAASARSLDELRATVPGSLRWVLADVPDADSLWRAEAAWWRRLQTDGTAMAVSARFDLTPVVGALALLAVDAWRVRAALELASHGGRPLDGFDAIV